MSWRRLLGDEVWQHLQEGHAGGKNNMKRGGRREIQRDVGRSISTLNSTAGVVRNPGREDIDHRDWILTHIGDKGLNVSEAIEKYQKL